MAKRSVQIKADVEHDTDVELRKWAEFEGRSKKRQLEILARKLTGLRKTNREDLERLGLADRMPST